MRKYLSIFSMLGLTAGMLIFTVLFLLGRGMKFADYKTWMSVLLSFSSLISNAAVGYYFAKKPQRKSKTSAFPADPSSTSPAGGRDHG